MIYKILFYCGQSKTDFHTKFYCTTDCLCMLQILQVLIKYMYVEYLFALVVSAIFRISKKKL